MNNRRLIIFFIFFSCMTLMLACIAGKMGTAVIFPGKGWTERSPESRGVDPVALDSALNYFKAHAGGAGADEMVIIRGGSIIWKGPGAESYHEIYSCTKVFTSTVLGILVTDGKLKAGDLAVKYLPELDEGREGQEVYSRLKLIHLASMTGGYDGNTTDCWQLHLQGRHDESYDCTQRYTVPGKPRFEPGTKVSYRDSEVHMLGYILTRVAGNSLEGIFRERIAEKIGMTIWDWSDYGYRDGMFFNNPAGTPNDPEGKTMNRKQGGVWIKPVDFARLGLLYLNKGKWDGKQLLDSAFVETAVSNQVPVTLPAVGLDLAGRYGLYWWTNGIRKDGTRPWPSAPAGTATPVGHSRNFCFVIPEWDMVIVRMSPAEESPMTNYGEKVWDGFFRRLMKDE